MLRQLLIADTSKPPYYAVIFTSLMIRLVHDYQCMSDKMIDLRNILKINAGMNWPVKKKA